MKPGKPVVSMTFGRMTDDAPGMFCDLWANGYSGTVWQAAGESITAFVLRCWAQADGMIEVPCLFTKEGDPY